jgi:DNA-binding CsgD family transcriptional regulator
LVRLIAGEGLNTRQVAERLGVSPSTVAGHIRLLYLRHRLPRHRAALVQWAFQNGLVSVTVPPTRSKTGRR